ncbi:MAG TPA: FAD-linked oxidase C-terminal domain-containing protein, partial [Acetobacteraceae bacterium]|nr:FAD-linked oxidase C-terminal domain-containing protein [Acetobacteraceae bacterium]
MSAAMQPGDTRFAARLSRELRGEVLFDAASRGRYATDASIYQVEPLGVVVPRSIDDVAATLALAREEGVPVLARGGGTSQCGQTVNRAVVLDFSKYLRRVLAIDAESRLALVEPGIVLSHLNAALRPHGLFFPVDPSTHARCTIGGMAGNNSCGAKSIRYGLMADNVRAIDALLADGTRYRFGAVPDNAVMPARIAELVQRLRALGAAEAEEIVARFPKLLRRVGGYNLDALTGPYPNLARLLVGSEGTLALSAAIELTLHPIKPRKVLGICQFPTFRAAMEATRHIVALDPEAVELVDRTMIDLGRGIAIYRPTIERMLIGEPDSLLIVEFHGHDDAPLLAKLADLEALMGDLGHPGAMVRATDAAFQADIAAVREAGLNIMMSMKGDAKPVSFIEDCAVRLEDLADYTERLNAVFARHGTKGTWYAHASVGCLHVRPVLNMKSPADIATMRAVAEECFALVREYKGSHSGEHGDGIVRSEFHASMFGPRLVRAFEQVKDEFDPSGLLNPRRIVRPPRMDDRTLFRYPPGYAAAPDFLPKLDWSDHPGGMLGAVEMCNNNGTCRAFDAGVMCPSYRVTRDEEHLTRGRANTLRLAMTGQLGPAAMASDAVADALKLCVSCKACRRECPTGVDMAKMKIEVLAARVKKHGLTLRNRLVGYLPYYASAAATFAPFVNLRNKSKLLRWALEKTAGFSARRDLPEWRRDVFAPDGTVFGPENGPEVVLFADTF